MKKFTLLVLVIILASSCSLYFEKIYDIFFQNNSGGAFLDFSILAGLPLAYVFFLFFIYTAFGNEKKYWWIIILVFPDLLAEFYIDRFHFYFPILLGLAGWLLGLGVEKLIKLIPKTVKAQQSN